MRKLIKGRREGRGRQGEEENKKKREMEKVRKGRKEKGIEEIKEEERKRQTAKGKGDSNGGVRDGEKKYGERSGDWE